MAQMNAPWMSVARALVGEAEVAGKFANPRIVEMFRVSGFPEVSSDETPWCAAFVNSCLACSGFQGTKSAAAVSFLGFGTDLGLTPEPGCVVLFQPLSAGASGHVGFYVGEDATTIKVLGGNQSDKVKEQSFPKAKLRAYRWPSQTAPLPQTTLPTILTVAQGEAPDHVLSPGAPPAPSKPFITPVPADNFPRVQPIIDQWEGGFSDHPQDPGGATNMGITQATLAEWRGHPVTKDDVRNLTREEAHQIYRKKYWAPLRCDGMPIALALMTYNAGVNSGPGRGARWLQLALNQQGAGVDVDGEVGPQTLDGCARVDVGRAVNDFAATQEAFLRGLSTFPTFGKGWMNRLTDVKGKAAALSSEPVVVVADSSSGPIVPGPQPADPRLDSIFDLFTRILKETNMATIPAATTTTTTSDSTQRAADIAAMLAQLAKLLAGQKVVADGTSTQTTELPLTTIDKLLGGDVLAGKKTLIAVIGYGIVGMLQIFGQVGPALGASATPTGQVLTLLLALLGGAGVASKADRVTQLLALLTAKK